MTSFHDPQYVHQRRRRTVAVIHGVEFSAREWEFACGVADCLPNRKIAQRMGTTEGTIKVMASRIFRRMQSSMGFDLRLLLARWVHCHRCTVRRCVGGVEPQCLDLPYVPAPSAALPANLAAAPAIR